MFHYMPLSVAAFALGTGLAFAQAVPSANLLDQWDIDGDGTLTLDEARTKRGELFFMFDTGNDGVLSAADWAGVASHMTDAAIGPGAGAGPGAGRGPGAVMHDAMTPAFNDANGDGQVTLEEFDAATDKLFAALDSNGDHLVTTADFGL